ncbi:MAG: 50S ribosomal protein L28 [Thermoanaerobacteraceae bacterium]|nr:50S ribosomal protein L28 [Thermoanaerobacteraceae bacterium]
MQLSHSHIRTKRAWKPNLQRVKALVNGTPRRIMVCTRCLRSGRVQRAI